MRMSVNTVARAICIAQIVLTACLGPAAAQSTTSPAAADQSTLQDWRKSTAPAIPRGNGCYKIEYPSREWKQVDCGQPPAHPPLTIKPQRQGGIRPEDLPFHGDYTMTPTVPIAIATGRLDKVGNITQVGSINDVDQKVADGKFTLQINSNATMPATPATGPSCSGRPNCKGWVQFVYNNDRQLNIQEWFINYLANATDSCPATLPLNAGPHCGVNVGITTLDTTAPTGFADLDGANLIGQVTSDGKALVSLQLGATSWTVVGTDLVGAFGNWTDAEFNVFGYGTVSKTEVYTRVQFNPEAQITVKLSSDLDFSGKAPNCHGDVAGNIGTTTAEDSNLFLGPCSTTVPPAISFNESPTRPTIDGIQPNFGSPLGGTQVKVLGRFTGALEFKLGDQVVTPTVGDPTSFISPPGLSGAQSTVTAAYNFPNGRAGPFSDASIAPVFTFRDAPACTLSKACPVHENQPPTYTVTCPGPTDFYEFAGSFPPDHRDPSPLTVVEANTVRHAGPTSAQNRLSVACLPGTQIDCHVESITVPLAGWCTKQCSQCGGTEKCCDDPQGGPRPVCVPKTRACPPIQ